MPCNFRLKRGQDVLLVKRNCSKSACCTGAVGVGRKAASDSPVMRSQSSDEFVS